MNDLEKKYFQALATDRMDSAKTMNKPSMKGIRGSVVEKYSDQAHFIYELLQNADDARATSASFKLLPDRLVFAHNGTRFFSITDPANEDRDSENGTLGDINAITSIGNSNKTEASIGKFGVGFKAVFQYTQTPHIYDPNFRFKIEQLFVPHLIESDYPGRKKNETLFVFPFDLPTKLSTEAYNDVSNKLKSLSYPLLFLNGLNYIEFEIGRTIGLYEKRIEIVHSFDDILAEKICLTQNSGNDFYDERLWLFSRNDEYGRRYSVGFFLDEKGKLLPVSKTAFCFFPTKETTNLSFIIHAPFLLTDSREGIRAGVPYNDNMLDRLADLAADSLSCLRTIGDGMSVRLIDDSILNIVPINKKDFSSINDKSRVSFMPFFDSMRTALADGLLPTETGYASKEYAYWSDTVDINRLFSDKQLTELIVTKAAWVFKSYGRNTAGHNAREGLQEYIDSLTHDWINEGDIFRNISEAFISSQSVEWLHSLYAWVNGNLSRRFANLKTKPIFLNAEGKPVAAFDGKGQSILFLPTAGMDGYETILPSLLCNHNTAEFVKQIGIKEPSLRDKIYNKILPKYRNTVDGIKETDSDFILLFNYYLKCPKEEIDSYISLIKECRFLKCSDSISGTGYDSANHLYLPSPEVVSFLEYKKNTRFVALEHYVQLIGPLKVKELKSFLIELGIKDGIQIITSDVEYNDSIRSTLNPHRSTKGYQWSENIIDGCKTLVQHIVCDKDAPKSALLWNTLINIAEEKCDKRTSFALLLKGKCRYFYYSWGTIPFDSSDARMLKSEKWMVDNDGNFVEPGKLTQDTIPDMYNTSSPYVNELFEFFGIKKSDADDVEDPNLSDSQRAKIKFANAFSAAGIDINNPEVINEFKQWQESKNGYVELPIDDPSDLPGVPLILPSHDEAPIPGFGKKKQKTITAQCHRETMWQVGKSIR